MRVEIRMDDGPWIQASGTMSWNHEWNTTSVYDGNHTIYARSYDGTDYSDVASVTVATDNGVPPPSDEEVPIFEQVWFWVAATVIVAVLLAALILEKGGKGRQREDHLSETQEPSQ